MATYYKYNALTRTLTKEPNYIVLIDGTTIVNPAAEQYASIRDAYPKGEDAPMPGSQEGKVVEYGGYELGDDNLWHKRWILVDAPTPPPRVFDKYRLVNALMEAGVWERVKAWLQAREGAWDRIVMAPDISEGEPLFKDAIAAAKAGFGWTDGQVEEILSGALA